MKLNESHDCFQSKHHLELVKVKFKNTLGALGLALGLKAKQELMNCLCGHFFIFLLLNIIILCSKRL